ncbi:MAG: EscU/YscU/HrcU family type III secretion system export apparatus switch protein [Actinomycetota bacterium]
MAQKETGQKTEAPTPKRRQEARRRGQIPRSSDLVGWLVLGAASFVLPALSVEVYDALNRYVFLATQALAAGDPGRALAAARAMAVQVGLVMMLFLFGVMATSAAAMAVQGGVTLTAEPLKPKWERISPWAGVKRLVGPQSAVDTAKAIVRLTVLVVLVFTVAVGTVTEQLGTTPRPLGAAGLVLASSLLLIVRLAALAGVVVGLADYAFQRWRVGRQLKMTKHEVKRESKNTEGDPVIRNRRRSLHAQVSRNQMLASVGDASVVVVNPTHYAVALAYNEGGVPKVVAKGADELAFRIRERAFALGVPVVESRPLGRMLHDHLDVGAEIPAELYEAVALVIAFVLRRARFAIGGVVNRVHVPASSLPDLPDLGDVGPETEAERLTNEHRQPTGDT